MTGRALKSRNAFTLLEALLAIATLAVFSVAISGLYFTLIQSSKSQSSELLVQSVLRSRMEQLVAIPYASVYSGSNIVVIQNESVPVFWNVLPMDLNGDATPEPDAKWVQVSVRDASLNMILTDTSGKLFKVN